MNHRIIKLVNTLFLALFLCLTGIVGTSFCAEESAQEALSKTSTPAEVDSILARLSDEQIRELLIVELAKENATDVAAVHQAEHKKGLSSKLGVWIQALNEKEDTVDVGTVNIIGQLSRVPGDLGRSFLNIGEGSFGKLLLTLLVIGIALAVGFGGEKIFARFTDKTMSVNLSQVSGGENEEASRLFSACLAALPSIINIAAFTIVSLFVFYIIGLGAPSARAAFMASLGAIVIGRSAGLVVSFFFSPEDPKLRLLPLGDLLAKTLFAGFRFFAWYVGSVMMLLVLLRDLGNPVISNHALGALLGTFLFVIVATKILAGKGKVKEAILAGDGEQPVPMAMQQFASMWHVLALMYLFVIWVIWINTILTGQTKDSGALIISFLVVPLYLIIDPVGIWLIGNIINVLGLKTDEETEAKKQEEMGAKYVSPEAKEQRLKKMMLRVFRFFIVLILFVWVMALWGFDVPFAAHIVNAAFDILITLTLALFIWRFISQYIERKIEESMPDEEEAVEDDGGEMGATRQLGRSYTLLPMIRKFLASAMIIMVALIVLSSIGVDIGPLLAGAGVLGLAVGFGAQKLVSDILSGVFYLLDDAFRVGEYIQAGSLKGAVEAITLRNVMLRHHRGMLQIVPHSDLGAITNFMRGGIVVKFPLEFPYDTDIEVVRKTIKKVGQAMLLDEELGPDFILPVKSQGVNEITNSVMVIRVKFTAHPGRQFMIKREAFRRITDALAKKGIHYAHRKVIVEVPQAEEDTLSPTEVKRVVEAGAAAGIITQQAAGQ